MDADRRRWGKEVTNLLSALLGSIGWLMGVAGEGWVREVWTGG